MSEIYSNKNDEIRSMHGRVQLPAKIANITCENINNTLAIIRKMFLHHVRGMSCEYIEK